MGAEIVSICAAWHDFWSWTSPPRLFFWLSIWRCTMVPYGNLHGTWLKPKRKHVSAEAVRTRGNATRRDNEIVSFRRMREGRQVDVISICKWRIFYPHTHTQRTHQFVAAHIYIYTRTRHTYAACSCSFIGTPFQLINMFVSINRNYVNYRRCVSEPWAWLGL